MNITIDLQTACEDIAPNKDEFQHWVAASLVDDVVEDCELSVRLVGIHEITGLNFSYRGKEESTNILSFPFHTTVPRKVKLLGDLVICNKVIATEARQQHKQIKNHWAHMIVHGCLHLLGYDHVEIEEAEQMEALEIKVLQSLNIGNPYLN